MIIARNYLSSVNCHPSPTFYQHVALIVQVEQILQASSSRRTIQKLEDEMFPEADSRDEVSITHDEENTI